MVDDAETESLASLLTAAGHGDRDAFAEVYRLASPRLYPAALRLMRHREAADDVLQEAFVSIWRKAHQYRLDRGQPFAWMARIVRNCAIDRLRADTRDPSKGIEWDADLEYMFTPLLGDGIVPQYLQVTLRGCLEQLPPNHMQAILLAYYYGLTHEELAAHLKTALGTVKSWVRRGLMSLKTCLDG